MTLLGGDIVYMARDYLTFHAMNENEQLFAEQYALSIDEIYRYVFFALRQHRETAEDVTAKIFLQAWKHRDRFDSSRASFRTYLYAIARNAVIDHYRTEKITEELSEQVAENRYQSQEGKVDCSLFWQDAQEILSSDEYHILILKYRNDLPLADIAQITEKTVDAVKASLYRSRKILKERLCQNPL